MFNSLRLVAVPADSGRYLVDCRVQLLVEADIFVAEHAHADDSATNVAVVQDGQFDVGRVAGYFTSANKNCSERTHKRNEKKWRTQAIFFHTVKRIGWEIKICQNGGD